MRFLPFALLALSAAAQTAPVYEVKRASQLIRADGRLSEPAWQTAPVAELKFPWTSQTGAMQKTRVRLLWDDYFLYAAFEADDTDIVAQHTQRDDPTYRDDCVELYLNPRPDQQQAYYGLEMNARGVLYDYLATFPKAMFVRSYQLNGVQLATVINGTLNQRGDEDRGWVLEVAVPWENFADQAGRPKAGAEWRANFVRWDGVEPARRLSIWSESGNERPYPHNPNRLGVLKFVE